MADTRKLLGHRIKELRLARKLKQSELAELIGIEPRSVSKIESGFHFPKDEHLEKISIALGVEIKDLFTFSHIKDNKGLLLDINNLLTKANENQLVTAHKIIEALLK